MGSPVNHPAQYFYTVSAGFREVDAMAVYRFGDAPDDTKWSIECILSDVLFEGRLSDALGGGHGSGTHLVDRSYDSGQSGHCGFGTSLRDVDPAASWPPSGDLLSLGPIDRGVIDSVVQLRTLTLNESGSISRGLVRVRRLTGSAMTIELPLKEIRYRAEMRIIADSRGHNEGREGMLARMRGKAEHSGSDLYAPCVLVEMKIILDEYLFDYDAFTEEQTIFVQTMLGPDGIPLINPAGMPLFHDHAGTDTPGSGSGFGGMILCAGALRVNLASGTTRRSAFIGEYGDNAFNGADGYPPNGTTFDEHESVTRPTLSGFVAMNAGEMVCSMELVSPIWSRDMGAVLEEFFDPDRADTLIEIREHAVMNSMRLGLTIRHRTDTVPSGQASMLVFNNGWTPGEDPSGQEANDLAVSIYRRCGAVCSGDVFGPWVTPELTSALNLLVDGAVYGWRGQTIIETPNGAYIQTPEDSPVRCDELAIAVPCETDTGLAPIRFRKDGGFIAGGTAVIDSPGNGPTRFVHVAGSTHSDPEAPPLVWTDIPCIDDGIDRRIAVVCDPQSLPEGMPSSVLYDANGATAGSLSYMVGDVGGGELVAYRLTDTIGAGEITPGSLSDLPCPLPMMVARACDDDSVWIIYDPNGWPDDGNTLLYNERLYRPTSQVSSNPVTRGYAWSSRRCVSNPCDGLLPNDPRCALPQFRSCPQCAGFDVGDPQPEPDGNQSNAGTDDGDGDGGGVGSGVGASIDPRQRAAIEEFLRKQMGCVGCGG